MIEGSLPQVIRAGFDYLMSGVYTAFPCIVITVHNNLSDQRVDVQPIINQMSPDGEIKPRSSLLSIPLMFPSSKTSALTFPVNKGDTVLCVFSQRSIDAFKASKDGLPCDPTDFRRFDKRDAIAIPGLFPFQKAINNPKARKLSHSTTDLVVAHNLGTDNECELRLKPSGDIIITTNANVTVNCEQATVNSETTINGDTVINGNLSVNGDVDISGTSTATDHISDGISGNSHVHGGVQSGGATTSGPS